MNSASTTNSLDCNPSEVELGETVRGNPFDLVEKTNPDRVCLIACPELRLLAQHPLRYRPANPRAQAISLRRPQMHGIMFDDDAIRRTRRSANYIESPHGVFRGWSICE